jgi:hypothetical protein
MIIPNPVRAAIGAVVLSLLSLGSAFAADPAAEVTLVTGRGTASSDEGVRPLVKGDSVYPGEIVASGPNSYINLKFTDGSFILLRPNSRFQIEDFRHAPAAAPAAAAPVPATPTAPAAPVLAPGTAAAADSGQRAFFRLLRGGFRAVSGLVGKVDRNEYRVATPVATIGIRGTDYLAVVCDAACAQDPVVRQGMPEARPPKAA